MESPNNRSRADLRLVRRRLTPPDAQSALAGLLAQIEPARADAIVKPPEISTAQLRYQTERDAIAAGSVIPLAFVPEISAAAPTVHDWLAPRWGEWRLADAWLEEPAAPALAGNPAPRSPVQDHR